MLKLFRFYIFFIWFLSANILLAQENVTTFGIQFKPIFGNEIMGSSTLEQDKNNIQFTLQQKPSMSFGMVVRHGFTEMLSVEGGINLLRRNYDLTISDLDTTNTINNSFRLLNYEIPFLGLVYIRLGENLYMNVAGGVSLNMYPSDLVTYDRTNYHYTARYGWLRPNVLANLGWEYRTRKSGYFYFGASYSRPMSNFMRTFVGYEANNKKEEVFFDMDGSYLTIDLRYFFHEKAERKIKKKYKKPTKVKRPTN